MKKNETTYFGANILENLTTGMYKDSKIIYREYIQNACDQIDIAIKTNLITKEEAYIEIWVDEEERTITIKDNATGISKINFESTLGPIANSQKKIGENKGFRGIGRLCGLAYCEELIFESGYSNENVISILKCDAKKMRKMIEDNNKGNKTSALEIINDIFTFSEREKEEKDDDHFFKVTLRNINKDNRDLLDINKIKDYLSFVAPVGYNNTFQIYRNKIKEYGYSLSYPIDEYNISLNAYPIKKNYVTKIKGQKSSSDDEIYGIELLKIFDSNNNLLAWGWYGVSEFKGIISERANYRGIRLRKENIQIGEADTLNHLFNEPRGNKYFIGEIFAVSDNLIPNSQRDYFNENSTRNTFENELKRLFSNLEQHYRKFSDIRSNLKIIDDLKKKEEEFSNSNFINKEEKLKKEEELKKLKTKEKQATQKIKKVLNGNNSQDIYKNYINRHIKEKNNTSSDSPKKISKNRAKRKYKKKDQYLTSKLSNLNRREQKLVSRIFSIIKENTKDKESEILINKIFEELKN